MVLHTYVKKRIKPERVVLNYISYISMAVGSIFLFWSFYPIISFEIYSRFFITSKVLTPVPRSNITSSLEQANSVLGASNIFSTNLSEYTKAGVWFPNKPQNMKNEIKSMTYFISIPKLNIKDAKVIVGGEDLSKSLVHYSPTSLPGEYGNVTIFGHSTLPQMYNSKDYKTIFTYLPSLNKGDKFTIKVEEANYEYEVYDMFVVDPDAVSVLDQKYDNAYMTLITCVPPGTYWKRLVVRSKLVKL